MQSPADGERDLGARDSEAQGDVFIQQTCPVEGDGMNILRSKVCHDFCTLKTFTDNKQSNEQAVFLVYFTMDAEISISCNFHK